MINDKSKKIIPAAFVFMFVALSFVIANTFGNTYAAGIILEDSYPESEAEAACASLGDWVYMEKSEGYGYIMCCPASDNTITAPGFTPNYGKCQTQKYSDGSCPSEYTSSSSAYCDATAKYFKVQGSNYLTVTFNPDGGELYDDGDKLIEEYVTSYTINYTDEEFNYSYFYAKRGDEEFFTGWTLNNCDNAKETGTYSGSDENITLKACYVDGVWVTFHNKNGAEYSKVLVEPGTKIPKDQLPDIIDPTGADATGWWSTGLNACDDQHAFVVSKEIVNEDMDLYPCYGGPTDEDYEDDDSGSGSSGGSSSGGTEDSGNSGSSGDSDSGSGSSGGSSSGGSGTGSGGSGNTGSTEDDGGGTLVIDTRGGTLYYDGIKYNSDIMSLSYIDHYLDYSKFVAISDDGDKFIGWEVAERYNCEDPAIDGGKPLPLEREYRLFACYDRGEEENLEEYTLSLNLNGGTLYRNNSKQTTSNFELSTFNFNEFNAKKDNSTFLGWDTNSNCNNPLISQGRLLRDDMDLYACYKTNSTSSGNTGGTNSDDDNSGSSGGSNIGDNNDSTVEQNPNTGSFMLYVVFLIGILSLGYTGYSVFKYSNNN